MKSKQQSTQMGTKQFNRSSSELILVVLNTKRHHWHFSLTIRLVGVGPHGVIVNTLDCRIVVSEVEL